MKSYQDMTKGELIQALEALESTRYSAEHDQAEEPRQRRQERFSLIARATNDAIWDVNVATNQAWWNESFYKQFGFDPQTTTPGFEAWTSRIHPDDLERVQAEFLAAVNGAAANWSCEYRYLRADRT